MKIALICGKNLSEMNDLAEELSKKSCEVSFRDLSGITIADFADGKLEKEFKQFDLVYYRSGFGDAGRQMLLRLLEKSQIPFVNRVWLEHPFCTNKIYQSISAAETGLMIPETIFGRFALYHEVVEKLGSPFILKAAEGIQGAKVFLVHNEEEFKSRIDAIEGDILFQRFVKNFGDYRVFMLGGKVYKIFKRVGQNGGFKNNMSLGALGERVDDPVLLEKLSVIAKTIVNKLNIEIGGIDIIEDSDTGQLYFLEANVNPGWKGLDRTLGTNTASFIADYLMHRTSH